MREELEAFVRDERAVAEFLAEERRWAKEMPGFAEDSKKWLALLADRDVKLAAVRATIGRIIDQGQGSLRGDIGSPLGKGLLASVECAGAFAQDIGDVAQTENAVVVENALRKALKAVSHE